MSGGQDLVEKDINRNPLPVQGMRRRQETIHLKILVPSVAVGAIIGKGGESIAKIQKETGARIRLSKLNDFYPGTEERVCLIQGTLEGVTQMHNYIMDKVLEKPDTTAEVTTTTVTAPTTDSVLPGLHPFGPEPPPVGVTSPGESGPNLAELHAANWQSHSTEPPGNRLPWGRHKQVKILVPNCTAGLVIGKQGSYVKEIKDRTGAFIQISQKSVEINLLERCITIAGEPEQCRAAVDLVLAKIAEDPQSSIYPTISYSQVRGPIASAYPTGSPFAFTPNLRFPGPQLQDVASQRAGGWNGSPVGNVHMSQLHQFGSPMFQAALIQASALAANMNQSAYYHQTSPPINLSSSDMNMNPTVTYASTDCAPMGGAPRSDEHGLYQLSHAASNPQMQLASTSLLAEGAGWPAAAAAAAAAESHLTGVPTSPCYEATYPGSLNIAYYPASQPLLAAAAMAARHAGDSYRTRTDFFPASPPYGPTLTQTNFPIPFSVNSSLGCPADTSLYHPVLSPSAMGLAQPFAGHLSPDPNSTGLGKFSIGSGSGGVAQPVSSTSTLSELFGSMRLACSTEEVGSELHSGFPTIQQQQQQQHPGYMNMAASGPIPMLSPTGTASFMPSLIQMNPQPGFGHRISTTFSEGINSPTSSSTNPIDPMSHSTTSSKDCQPPCFHSNGTSLPSSTAPNSSLSPDGLGQNSKLPSTSCSVRLSDLAAVSSESSSVANDGTSTKITNRQQTYKKIPNGEDVCPTTETTVVPTSNGLIG